ncbi:chitobiase/beta-hexosaminidase C-terminal domain-containing protein [Pseudoflavonifractor phocaeensis]|uniref:chitobiase/beta-hexosaminidase C-terminal domain-containing protein n=1 Tax=Pseudoflavonifractor phocaeensis TaxID=1870988 RepID=UPI00313DC1F4
MGNINYAQAFAPKVAETFKKESLTDSATGKGYSFSGVRSIKVMSVDTVPLNDYRRSGSNRYGEPVELGDTVQELTMRDDKSFAMTIDKGNQSDQMNLKGAARAMRRETEQVMVPYVDKYRFREWAANAGIVKGLSAAPAKNTIVDAVFDAGCDMDNLMVPGAGRTLFLPNTYYKLLALSDQFLGVDKLGAKVLTKGEMGEIDGMTVKRVPDSYFPENVYFMVKYKGCTVDPVKLNEANIHTDPPGISGNLMEGRFYHDAFVLGAKANGLYVAAVAGKVAAAPTFTEANSKVTLASTTTGAVIRYTDDGSDPRYSASAKVYAAPFDVPTGKKVRAFARKDGEYASVVSEKAY